MPITVTFDIDDASATARSERLHHACGAQRVATSSEEPLLSRVNRRSIGGRRETFRERNLDLLVSTPAVVCSEELREQAVAVPTGSARVSA